MVGLDLLIIVLLVLFNGLLAMAELSIVSSRRTRLEVRAAGGDAGAALALSLASQPTRFLSTIQIGITLVGILVGAFGEAALSDTVAGWIEGIGGVDAYAHAISVVLVVLAVTLLSVMVGELIPKRLALHAPERIAARLARPTAVLSVIVGPVATLLSGVTDAALRPFHLAAASELPVTEEEIQLLLEEGAAAGVFEEAEQDLVERIFHLGDQRASELMTPRHRIEFLDVEDAPDAIRTTIARSRFSSFPLCEGDLDHIVGVLSARDYWAALEGPDSPSLGELAAPPLFVPESMPALRVADMFKKTGQHRALVVDEYGIIQGLVTFTDIFEVIVGDIDLPSPGAPRAAVRRDDNSWLIDGAMPLDALKQLLGIAALPDEGRGVYSTLAGFMLLRFGRIPQAADWFSWNDLRFEVVDMDGNRIDKVLVARTTGSDGNGQSASNDGGREAG